jgi:hypothetical protein
MPTTTAGALISKTQPQPAAGHASEATAGIAAPLPDPACAS